MWKSHCAVEMSYNCPLLECHLKSRLNFMVFRSSLNLQTICLLSRCSIIVHHNSKFYIWFLKYHYWFRYYPPTNWIAKHLFSFQPFENHTHQVLESTLYNKNQLFEQNKFIFIQKHMGIFFNYMLKNEIQILLVHFTLHYFIPKLFF